MMASAVTEKRVGSYFVQISGQEAEISKWIEFIVMKTLPVLFVDCKYTRDIARLKYISLKTLPCHILDTPFHCKGEYPG